MTREEEIKRVLESLQVDRLLKILRMEACKRSDGHFTVFAFTTCYAVAFGTPNGSDAAMLLPTVPTMKGAIIKALINGYHCLITPEAKKKYLAEFFAKADREDAEGPR